MKKPIGKVGTILIVVATVILAGVAVFTAFRLYDLRQQTVAPNAPSSNPKAESVSPTPVSACSMSFIISAESSPTPTPTGSSTPTPTASATPTPTSSGEPNSCGGTCGSNSNCASGYYCYNGYCRNPSCPEDTDCVCPGSTTTTSASPTEASLPQSGTNWPTFAGVGLGILIVFGSILLAI